MLFLYLTSANKDYVASLPQMMSWLNFAPHKNYDFDFSYEIQKHKRLHAAARFAYKICLDASAHEKAYFDGANGRKS